MPAYKEKDAKTWYVSVRYEDWTGKKTRKVKRGFATKREALEWERKFLLKENASLDMTFDSFLELYKEDLKNRLKLSTWIMKTSVIDQKILPYFKNKRMCDIKTSDVIAWQKEIMAYRDEDGNGAFSLAERRNSLPKSWRGTVSDGNSSILTRSICPCLTTRKRCEPKVRSRICCITLELN